MKSEDSSQLRARTEDSRRRPQIISEVNVSIDGIGEIEETKAAGPVLLNIEATDQHGEVAPWFDDFWWTEVLQRWANRMVTVQIAATPHAVLHPVIIYHMDMLDRVAPRWRTLAYTYTNEFSDTEAIEAIARSPFHEVRFLEGPRPDANSRERLACHVRADKLFGDVRRIQARIGSSRPILTRLPSSATIELTPAANVSQLNDSLSLPSVTTQPTAP